MKTLKFLKTFLTVILAELIVIGSLAAYVTPVQADDSDIIPIASNRMSSSFYMSSGSTEFFYDDAYFNQDASVYNHSFATTSLCLAMAAFNPSSGSYSKGYTHAEDMLKKMGFGDIYANEYYQEEPGTDTMGVIIGTKRIERRDGKIQPVIAVALRGGNYEAEWAGNLTIGTQKEHQGFAAARDIAAAELGDYMVNNSSLFTGSDCVTPKIWIVGYSRASATANLTGCLINCAILDEGEETDNYKRIHHFTSSLGIQTKDVYVFGFEVPQGVYSTSSYSPSDTSNIWCIINPEDPVPYVAPSYMGFTHAGNIVDPTEGVTEEEFLNELRQVDATMIDKWVNSEAMHEFQVRDANSYTFIYKLWKGKSFSIASKSSVGSNNGEFSSSLFNNMLMKSLELTKRYMSSSSGKSLRQIYVDNYQDVFRTLAHYLMGGAAGGIGNLLEAGKKAFQNNFGAWDIVKIVSNLSDVADGAYGGIAILLIVDPIVKGTLEDLAKDPSATAVIPKSELETISSKHYALSALATALYISEMNNDFQHLTTALTYKAEIFYPHCPEYTLAYMRAGDVNYLQNTDQYQLVISSQFSEPLDNININVYDRNFDSDDHQELAATLNKNGLSVFNSSFVGSGYYDVQQMSLYVNRIPSKYGDYVFEITCLDDTGVRQNIAIDYNISINGPNRSKKIQPFESSTTPIAYNDVIELVPVQSDLQTAELRRYINLEPVFVDENFNKLEGGSVSVRTDGKKADMTRLLVTGSNEFTIVEPDGTFLYDLLLPVYDDVFGNQVFDTERGIPQTRHTDNPTNWTYNETSMPLYIVCSTKFKEGSVYGDIIYQHKGNSQKLLQEINTTTLFTIENKTKGSSCSGTGSQSLEAEPGDEIIMTFDESTLPDGIIFNEWSVRSDAKVEKTENGTTLTFFMPKCGVEVHAMTGDPINGVTLTFTGAWAHPTGSTPDTVDGNWQLCYIDPQYADISYKKAAHYYPVKHVYRKINSTPGKAWISAPTYMSDASGDLVFDHWEAFETDTGEPYRELVAVETYFDSRDNTYKTQNVYPTGVKTETIVLEKIKKSITLVPVYKVAEYTVHIKYSHGGRHDETYAAKDTVIVTDRKTLGYEHEYWEGYYYPLKESVDSYGNVTRSYSEVPVNMGRYESPDGVYTFTMPKGDVYVTATFHKALYDVTWTGDAIKTSTGETAFYMDDEVTLVPDNLPHSGYLANIEVVSGIDPDELIITRDDSGAVVSATFTMPNNEVVLDTEVATYNRHYLTTVNATAGYEDGYTITSLPNDRYSVYEGDIIRVKAELYDGMYFKEWKVEPEISSFSPAGEGEALLIMPDEDVTVTAVLGTLKNVDNVELDFTSAFGGNKLVPESAAVTAGEGVAEESVILTEVSEPWFENPAIFGWEYKFRFTLTPDEGYYFNLDSTSILNGVPCSLILIQDDGSALFECALTTNPAHITKVDDVNALEGLPAGTALDTIQSRMRQFVNAYVQERNGWISPDIIWDWNNLTDESGNPYTYDPTDTLHEHTFYVSGTLDISDYVGEPLEYVSEDYLLFTPDTLKTVKARINVLADDDIPMPYVTDNQPGTYETSIDVTLACDKPEADIWYVVGAPRDGYDAQYIKENGAIFDPDNRIELTGEKGTDTTRTIYAVALVEDTNPGLLTAVPSGYFASDVAEFTYIISLAADPVHELTVINGTGSGSYPYDNETLVGIRANNPENGTVYTGFTVDEGSVDFISGGLNKDFGSFYMPDSDVTITANYKITMLEYLVTAPVAGKTLAEQASPFDRNPSTADLIDFGGRTIRFYDGDGNEVAGAADYNTIYTAGLEISSDGYYGYTFADDVIVLINGEAATVTKSDDSNIEVSLTFPKTSEREYLLLINNGTVVYGESEKFLPPGSDGAYRFYAGSPVKVAATVPEGSRFSAWNEPTGTLTLDTAEAEFAMPAKDLSLTAQFEKALNEADITMLLPEKPDWKLPVSGDALSEGLSETTCVLTWTKDNDPAEKVTEPGSYLVQTILKAADGFYFAEDIVCRINDETCDAVVLDGGKTLVLSKAYEFDNTEPETPTEPETDPTKPTEPTQPTQPTNPTQPTSNKDVNTGDSSSLWLYVGLLAAAMVCLIVAAIIVWKRRSKKK